MSTISTPQIRNVALIAHNGAGKTSLADALYYTSGGSSRQGRVEDKTSASDFEPEEQRRGSSIQTAVLPCSWKGHKINLLDTPGYPDFRGEMLSALRVADAAIIVISASAGIEVGARQAWSLCEEFDLPRAIVINKLDRENSDFDIVVRQITELWGRHCVPVQAPEGREASFKGVSDLLLAGAEAVHPKWRARLMEAVAESDDDLAEKFILTESLELDEMVGGLKAAFVQRTVVPVFATSANSNIGTSELLDAMVSFFPSPADMPAPEVPSGCHACFVFKTNADPFVGRLSFFRVYGAPLSGDLQLWNESQKQAERLGQLYQPNGRETVPVSEIASGDIGVVAKLSKTVTFDTLCDRNSPVVLNGVDLPLPVFSLAVSPKTQADLDKMASALSRTAEEDPTLHVERNPDTKETVLSGLGDIHVETAIERIARKFDVKLESSLPRIPYRETVTTPATIEYRHKKQSGGRGQFGHVVLKIAPLAAGEGVKFSSRVVGGNVPKEYIPAVEKGVRNASLEGVVAGFPVVDVDVTLTDGSSHSVDSSGMAFEIAGSMGFKKGVQDARPTLLEPVMKLTILVPEDCAGAVMGDLNTRRARIQGMEPRGVGFTEIVADVPASQVQRYAADIRSLTQARGTFSARFDHYEAVPAHDAQKVIASLRRDAVSA